MITIGICARLHELKSEVLHFGISCGEDNVGEGLRQELAFRCPGRAPWWQPLCCLLHHNCRNIPHVNQWLLVSCGAHHYLAINPTVSSDICGISLATLLPHGGGQFLFYLFCFDSSRGSDRNDMQIILTASKIDNMEAILTACQAESVEAKDLQVPVQVKYQNKTYKLHGPPPFKNSPIAVISSLSL
jgi:hypothetical protein